MKVTAVILAAGQGTRMRSLLPKVLHPLAGQPLIQHALQAASAVSQEIPVVIVGHGSQEVRRVLGNTVRFAEQEKQLGTANALQAAEELVIDQTDLVLVTSADMPLLTSDTLKRLVDIQMANPGPMTMATIFADDPHGFGRVIRAEDGSVKAIVEEAQATPEQLLIRELNVGAYCFRSSWLWNALKQIKVSPKGEYYLTDAVEVAVSAEMKVQAVVLEDIHEAIGINNRAHLAEAEGILCERVNRAWMMSGVTLVNPANTYIEPTVKIGQDTIIWPNSYLRGKTVIGEECVIGPNAVIDNARLGNQCTVLDSVLEGAVLADRTKIGPFEHLKK